MSHSAQGPEGCSHPCSLPHTPTLSDSLLHTLTLYNYPTSPWVPAPPQSLLGDSLPLPGPQSLPLCNDSVVFRALSILTCWLSLFLSHTRKMTGTETHTHTPSPQRSGETLRRADPNRLTHTRRLPEAGDVQSHTDAETGEAETRRPRRLGIVSREHTDLQARDL